MSDFDTFMNYLKEGDADGVRMNFRQDFLDKPDGNNYRPIHYACNHGYVAIAEFLIEQGCDIECKNNYENTPLHVACIKGHVAIAEFLIEQGCDIECKNNNENKPIHFACKVGHVDIVKLLVRKRCRLQSKTLSGRTPLDCANTNNHNACADVLTKYLQLTQFFKCVRKNECQTFRELKTVDFIIKEERETGLSFLEVVLEVKATAVLKYFLDQRVEDKEIPLIKCFIENCSRPVAVELLQEFFLYRSIRDHHADGFELSFLANIVNGHRNIVTTSFVETAAKFGTSVFITEILKKSIYNKDEWTRAKDLAKQNGHNKIVDAISDREILLNSREKAHFSSLHNAICDNDPDLMRYIFDKGLADPNFNNEVVGTGLSFAHILSHARCIETLQQFNVDVNTENKYSQSPLHEAISSCVTEHCSYLISRTENIDKPGFMGLSGLQFAVMKGLENLCGELVKNGADCMLYVEDLQQSHFKDTALPISTRENAVTLSIKENVTVYPCFLDILDAKKVNCSDGDENTLLHLAVKVLLPDLCQSLINYGANVHSINAEGNSPLIELFNHSDDKLMNGNLVKIIRISNILLASGADINSESCSGVTKFESASQCSSERIMLHLLSKHPDLRIPSGNDFKLAFYNTWFAYAKDLIDQMPEDSLKSFISTADFHTALTHDTEELLISLFIKASSDVQQSIIEDLLLHFAANDKCVEFTKVLETKVIEPKLFLNGETLFTSLLKNVNLKYCRAIIRQPAYRKCLNLANFSNQIPLQIAIDRELYDLICPLIFECDQLNHEDNDGNIPLKQLFQKLTNSTDNSIDEKLMTAVKATISNGGNIFKETLAGNKVFEFCLRSDLRDEIEAFQRNKNRRDAQMIKERDPINICDICMDRKWEINYECGHSLCTPCGNKLTKCPNCMRELKNPRRIYLN